MLYTRYGSPVNITRSYKEQRELGVFLVAAMVTAEGQYGAAAGEQPGQTVMANDPFNKGWISSNELVAEGGQIEIIQACLRAPNGQPDNTEQLLKLYWPQTFGRLEIVGGASQAVTQLRNAAPQIRVA